MKKLAFMTMMLTVLGCGSLSMTPVAQSGGMPKDGELDFPKDYNAFPTFLKGIQKPDAVRDLYINPTGASAQAGQAFANGSILVMEIYNAQKTAEGAFEKGADGNLVKANLAKIFVMQKDAGWGKGAPENLKNGDWIYSGIQTKRRTTGCRLCGLPGLPSPFRRSQRFCPTV